MHGARKPINTQWQQMHAIKPRLGRAEKTWGAKRKNYFDTKTFHGELRIQLSHALVRATITYSIRTNEITPTKRKKLNEYKQKCIRQIRDAARHIQKITQKANQAKRKCIIHIRPTDNHELYKNAQNPTIT